jgi:hypothetical protein
MDIINFDLSNNLWNVGVTERGIAWDGFDKWEKVVYKEIEIGCHELKINLFKI